MPGRSLELVEEMLVLMRWNRPLCICYRLDLIQNILDMLSYAVINRWSLLEFVAELPDRLLKSPFLHIVSLS